MYKYYFSIDRYFNHQRVHQNLIRQKKVNLQLIDYLFVYMIHTGRKKLYPLMALKTDLASKS